jgi:hypothetical protein
MVAVGFPFMVAAGVETILIAGNMRKAVYRSWVSQTKGNSPPVRPETSELVCTDAGSPASV